MNLTSLPAIGQPLDTGMFVGLTTTREGAHCAVVLLEPKPPGRLAWQAAMDWAKSVEGELPSRPVQALLYANARSAFEASWYWSAEAHEDDGSYAWGQGFSYGDQYDILRKSYKGSARAVRLIPLTASILPLAITTMPTITIEDVKAEQARLAALIEQLQANAAQPAVRVYTVREATIELKPGEHYAGLVLDADGNASHHLVLLPGEGEDLAWQAARDWATAAGGDLPTRQEQALLYANLKGQFKPQWHWSAETYSDDGSYAWGQDFFSGGQGGSRKRYGGSARAVRRFTA